MRFRVFGEKDGDIWLFGEHEVRDVWSSVTREAIEDDTDPPQSRLSSDQCMLIVEANLGVLSTYLSRLIEPQLLLSTNLPERPHVTIRSGDLRSQGIRLSASILEQDPMSWVDTKTGRVERP